MHYYTKLAWLINSWNKYYYPIMHRVMYKCWKGLAANSCGTDVCNKRPHSLWNKSECLARASTTKTAQLAEWATSWDIYFYFLSFKNGIFRNDSQDRILYIHLLSVSLLSLYLLVFPEEFQMLADTTHTTAHKYCVVGSTPCSLTFFFVHTCEFVDLYGRK